MAPKKMKPEIALEFKDVSIEIKVCNSLSNIRYLYIIYLLLISFIQILLAKVTNILSY